MSHSSSGRSDQQYVILFATPDGGEKVVGVFRSEFSARRYASVVGRSLGAAYRVRPIAKRNPLREESYSGDQS